jgi:histidyl-tRNA synthetase
MGKPIIKSIRGMSDQLPELCELWERVEQAIRDVVRLYGYREIRTPIIEKTDLFSRSIGEETDIVEKEMYTFRDRNQDSLTLRPEATASCVRAGIQHGLLYNQTHRLWYLGPMFRHERPQKGRYRQFHQFGIEGFGWVGPDIDSEIIALGTHLWATLELPDVVLEINSLGSVRSRSEYVSNLKEYLGRRSSELDEDSQRRLESNPLRILDSKDPITQEILNEAPDLASYLDDADKRHFDKLLEYLQHWGIEYQVNTRLVRGLDYYTGAVFEWKSSMLGSQNTFCGGGRYDGLIEQLGGPAVPAVGFACGLERLIDLYKTNQSNLEIIGPEVWMIMLGSPGEEVGYPLAEELRQVNIQVVCNCGGGDIKKQLRRADQNKALIAVIIGDEEVSSGRLTVKPLRSGEVQMLVVQDQLVEVLLSQLARERAAL